METITITSTVREGGNNILSLGSVDWKPNYVLSRASIGQIMVCFSKILYVVPKNIYEDKLYEKLKPLTEHLLNDFKNLLTYTGDKDRDVKFYNLLINMPINVSVNDREDGLIKLKYAKIGSLIKAAKQRIKFIIERDAPERYLGDQELLQEFNNLKSRIKNFLDTMNDYEAEFINAIDSAHKAQQVYFNNA